MPTYIIENYIMILAMVFTPLCLLGLLFFILLRNSKKKLRKTLDRIEKHKLKLKNKELLISNMMADTTLETEKLKSLAKDELNKFKLKEMGTFERELREIKRKRLKEIDSEVEQYEKQKLEKTEQIIETKIVEKQKELMQFEIELDDILYETELGHKEKMEAIFAALNKLKSMESAAVDARRRQYQDSNYIEFHSIIIDEDEKNQIDRLLDVVSTIPGEKIKLAVNRLVFDSTTEME